LSRIPAIWRHGIDSSCARVVRRDAFDRLTEDLDVANDRVFGLPIGEESVLAVSGVLDNGVDRVVGVQEIGALADS
jgi:hypothetical protein